MTLADVCSLNQGKKLEVVLDYFQQYIDDHWQQLWEEHLTETERIFREKLEGPAYAYYSQQLFEPMQNELKTAGFTTKPVFPGAFQQSHEQGPEEERVRRFWCVLYNGRKTPLGTLIIHFFHDHTRLRLPKKPKVSTLNETDPETIQRLISQMS